MADSRDTNENYTMWQFLKLILVFVVSSLLYRSLADAVAALGVLKQMVILSITGLIGLCLIVRWMARVYGLERKVSKLAGILYLTILAVGIAAIEVASNYAERLLPAWVLIGAGVAFIAIVLMLPLVMRRRSRQEE